MSMERLQVISPFDALGTMVSTCVHSDTYMSWNLRDLANYFMPPIALGQYSIFVSGQRIVGFITWAFLSDELTRALRELFQEPGSEEWKSGTQLWFMDMVSTHGFTRDISRMLQQEILRNATSSHAYAIRRRADGSVRKTARFPVIHDGKK
jgi:hemolysin-activating ACP:hemolysin acyltransferase